MRSDIIDKDADGFSSNVDFPAFRESLRTQIMAVMQNRLSANPQLQKNPFADIGMMLGASVVTQFIDTMVTPAGIGIESRRLFGQVSKLVDGCRDGAT
ncbi:hypothetical protein C5O80_20385 [Burkholderia sp. SRS-46]|nr:hypothetical protein C5O80_20385 [Burkholderia sp. SRS-46]